MVDVNKVFSFHEIDVHKVDFISRTHVKNSVIHEKEEIGKCAFI